jgi:hypothetical protein
MLDIICREGLIADTQNNHESSVKGVNFNIVYIKPTRIYNINPLAPSDPYMGHTAQLTSRHCILNTYSTNIRTEYFKRAALSPFFSLQNAVYFIIPRRLVPVLFTF